MHSKATWVLVGAATAANLGCGKSNDAAAGAPAGRLPAIAKECQGFDLTGLRYSPGGDALPNRCKPFDVTTNNPYAVRCVDALPGYATAYPGDEYCVLPPPPDKGVQLGVHPQGTDYWKEMWAGDFSGYSNAARTKAFEVAAGGEIEQTYRTALENDEAHFYYRLDSRMRSGSHHMATYLTSTSGEEGWLELTPDLFIPADADGGTLWNAQRPNADRPGGSLSIPDEDTGIGMTIGPKQGILLDVHHFNTRDIPILREVWINLWWVEGSVTKPVKERPLLAKVDIPPNTQKVLEGSFAPTAETRVLSLFGHRHAWTTRFNAWVHRADGTDEAVYDSFNWLDVPTYSYDSLSENPVADAAAEKDGAASGVLTLVSGDELHFNCHVDTTQEHAAAIGVPVPTDALVFGNKAFGAEMCVLNAETIEAPSGDQ